MWRPILIVAFLLMPMSIVQAQSDYLYVGELPLNETVSYQYGGTPNYLIFRFTTDVPVKIETWVPTDTGDNYADISIAVIADRDLATLPSAGDLGLVDYLAHDSDSEGVENHHGYDAIIDTFPVAERGSYLLVANMYPHTAGTYRFRISSLVEADEGWKGEWALDEHGVHEWDGSLTYPTEWNAHTFVAKPGQTAQIFISAYRHNDAQRLAPQLRLYMGSGSADPNAPALASCGPIGRSCLMSYTFPNDISANTEYTVIVAGENHGGFEYGDYYLWMMLVP